MSPFIEAAVAKVDDLKDGDMRQVTVDQTDVLLVRKAGKFYAVGAYCTHYQAALAEGVLSGDSVVCPWHNAYFNITTGEQQEPPGLDSLSCYQVRIEGENVIVQVPQADKGQRHPTMTSADYKADGRTFVILGGGAAGAHAAETLRTVGYQGKIILISQEDRLPYDRTWLSKDYFTGKATAEQMPLRSSEFYADHQIEVRLKQRAAQIDVANKTITFQNGNSLSYDALLIATGGQPRQLEIPGAALQNVFTLRSFADTDRILAAAKTAAQAVVVGSSFIGMEAAAGLAQQGVQVTVVSPDAVPFEKILGEQIGKLFQQVHEENGVTFKLNRKVARLEGSNTVEKVVLDNDEIVAADMVVVGIGVKPATDLITGLALHERDQSVIVNEYLQAAEGIYAAGDIARYPDWRTGDPIRVEHWRIAAQQGRIAAYNMAGKPTPFRAVPIFWSAQFDFPLRYIGHATQWDELLIDGELQQRQFIALFVKDDQILAAAASQRDSEIAAIQAIMQLDQMPLAAAVHPGFDWVEYLRSQAGSA